MVKQPYTKAPKWVMRCLVRGVFKPRQAQVLLFYVEMTSGYNRAGFEATAKKIAEDTGLRLNHVYSALKDLLEMGALVQTEEGVGPAPEVPNQDWINSQIGTKKKSQNGTKLVPKRDKIAPNLGLETASKSSEDAGSENAKKNTKEKSKRKGDSEPVSDASFLTFRAAYPKCKRNKEWATAEATWKKHHLSEKDLPQVLAALEEDKVSRDWKKDNGDWIPLPASWLNKQRWKDAAPAPSSENVIPFQAKDTKPWEPFLRERRTCSYTDSAWAEMQANRLNHHLKAGLDARGIRQLCEGQGLDEACRVMWEAYEAAERRREAERAG